MQITDFHLAEKLFISPTAAQLGVDCMYKALELIMKANVPPPFRMSCDVVDDTYCVVAIPDYDYDKNIDETMKKFGEEDQDITRDDVMNLTLVAIPAIVVYNSDHDMIEGRTIIEMRILNGARVFCSRSLVSDLTNNQPLISLN